MVDIPASPGPAPPSRTPCVAGALHAALEQAADLPGRLAVAGPDAAGQPVQVVRRAVDPHAKLLDRLAARDLALVVATHTIRDDVEAPRVVSEERVLVDLTAPAYIRASNREQLQRRRIASWRLRDRLARLLPVSERPQLAAVIRERSSEILASWLVQFERSPLRFRRATKAANHAARIANLVEALAEAAGEGARSSSRAAAPRASSSGRRRSSAASSRARAPPASTWPRCCSSCAT